MRYITSISFCLIFLITNTFAQSSSDPIVGGVYFQGSGNIGIFVGDKDIARITVTLSAKNEFGKDVNYSRPFTIIGPFFTYGKYQSQIPNYFLGRYPMGYISKIQVVYKDKTVKVFGKKRSVEICGEYFDKIGRGY